MKVVLRNILLITGCLGSAGALASNSPSSMLTKGVFEASNMEINGRVVQKYAPFEQTREGLNSRKRIDRVTATKSAQGFWEGTEVTPSILGFTHSAGQKGDSDDELLRKALKIFEETEIGCHYLIHTSGQIYQLVPEESRAFWAGVSHWPAAGKTNPSGKNDVNSHSLSIMVVSGAYDLDPHTIQYLPFPDAQIASTMALSEDIARRYPILPENIVRYSDVKQFGGKLIPGPAFPMEQIKALFERS